MNNIQSCAHTSDDALLLRCEQASRLARDRLLDVRTKECIWEDRLDANAFSSAAFILMLRTTGAIDLPDGCRDEMRLLRHMLCQTNEDGGFWRYPGSRSCRALTCLVSLSMQLTLGRVSNHSWPRRWFRPNERIESELEARVESAIERAEEYLHRQSQGMGMGMGMEFESLLTCVLTAYIEPSRRLPPLPLLSPRFLSALDSWPILRKLPEPLNLCYRKSLPALAILSHSARKRKRNSNRVATSSGKSSSSCQRMLVNAIRSDQGENGGWVYNSLYPSLNLMALREHGTALEDPVFERGLSHLRHLMVDTSENEAYLDFMTTDIWDTTLAALAYLSIPGQRATDVEIVPAIEFLLRWQGSSGGFAFGSGFTHIPDTDSTAFVVLCLKKAHSTASSQLRRAIDDALGKGKKFLLSKQDRRGGFPAYEPSAVGTPNRPFGFLSQILFDQATPDVTARSLAALGQCGLTPDDRPLRRGIMFLFSIQHPNGGWWSRWWSGYLVGTSMVLYCLGKLGLFYPGRAERTDRRTDRQSAAIDKAYRRALKFIREHQNEDGGWGETTAADFDASCAGVGPSTPMHSAVTLWALLTCRYPQKSSMICRGIEYLLNEMSADGVWNDDGAVFTVVPRIFYYRHPIFNYMLPLLSLGEFLHASKRSST